MTIARTKLPLRKEFTGDRQADRAQDNANEAQKAINAVPFLPTRGRYLRNIVVPGSASRRIVHGLGRPISGWIVTRIRVGLAGAVQETASDANSFTLANGVGTPTTLDLWVF